MAFSPPTSNDPLLTSLCNVCRAVPPRYKCPRCGLRSCSVSCSRRHRVRAGCSGIRDVTAFMPRNQLCTPAGLDHDFNFLHGIELARSRAEREIVDERHLFRPRDVHHPRVLGEEGGEDRRRASRSRPSFHGQSAGKGRSGNTLPPLQKEWHGDELRFVSAATKAVTPLGAQTTAVDGSHLGRRVRALCQRGGIAWYGVPHGMARQRENKTVAVPIASDVPLAPGQRPECFGIAWQVEWLVYEDGVLGKPTRVLRRGLDHEPLFRLYASAMSWVLQKPGVTVVDAEDETIGDDGADDDDDDAENDDNEVNDDSEGHVRIVLKRKKKTKQHNRQKKRQKRDAQRVRSERLFTPAYPFQNTATGEWETVFTPDTDGDLDDDHRAAKHNVSYYLLWPRLPMIGRAGSAAATETRAASLSTKELIPLDPSDTLANALRGRSVLEFPTIYVLPRTPAFASDGKQQSLLPANHILGSTTRQKKYAPLTPVAGSSDGNDDNSADSDSDDEAAPPVPKTSSGYNMALRITKDCRPLSFSGIQEMDETAGRAQESETSSEGSTSTEESEGESEEKSDAESDGEEEGGVQEEGRRDALPLLHGLVGDTKGRPPLVVYESWSEGSVDEA